MKDKLVILWSDLFKGDRKGLTLTKEHKLKVLIDYSNLKIEFRHQQSLGVRRAQYEKMRVEKKLFKNKKDCFVCFEKAKVLHHIIQLQNGGINSKKNLVPLCNSCHAEIHPWLKEKKEPISEPEFNLEETLKNTTPTRRRIIELFYERFNKVSGEKNLTQSLVEAIIDYLDELNLTK